MTAIFEIIKGQKETVTGLMDIVELMYNEGIDSANLNDGRIIIVYGNGTYEINN